MHSDRTEECHADFDGDEYHLYFVTGFKGEVECEMWDLFGAWVGFGKRGDTLARERSNLCGRFATSVQRETGHTHTTQTRSQTITSVKLSLGCGFDSAREATRSPES